MATGRVVRVPGPYKVCGCIIIDFFSAACTERDFSFVRRLSYISFDNSIWVAVVKRRRIQLSGDVVSSTLDGRGRSPGIRDSNQCAQEAYCVIGNTHFGVVHGGMNYMKRHEKRAGHVVIEGSWLEHQQALAIGIDKVTKHDQ